MGLVARRENDFYETPPWMVEALLLSVPEIGGRILEPCSGDGSIVKVLEHTTRCHISRIVTNDLDPVRHADYHLDATDEAQWAGRHDWVITNPPFAPEVMFPIVRNAVKHARVGVAMLGRISFLEPCKTSRHGEPRGPWLALNPPQRYLVTERHSFTGNGKSDSCTTAWLVWSKVPLSGAPIQSLYGWKS
jgi:hypothetical protein